MSDTPIHRSASGHDLTPPDAATLARLSADLSAEERRVLLHQGTEPPFCGGLLHNKADGVYRCRLCDLPLFHSSTKFESGTGWPSFYQAYDPEHVRELRDTSHGMLRIEIRCARCDGHLGHVFDDGPPPTGRRYCLNSLSLRFVPNAAD
jgi:peptide-methionine (R)-S-oxide reductase